MRHDEKPGPETDARGRRRVTFLSPERLLGIADELTLLAPLLGGRIDAVLFARAGQRCASFQALAQHITELSPDEVGAMSAVARLLDENIADVVEQLADLRPAQCARELILNLSAYVLTWGVVVSEWDWRALTPEQEHLEDMTTVCIKWGVGLLDRAALSVGERVCVRRLVERCEMQPHQPVGTVVRA